MVSKSPKDRVVGPLPSDRFMAYKWGVTKQPLTKRDDPASTHQVSIKTS